MSSLVLSRDQFPDAIPTDAKVGATLTVQVTGTISKIEADIVDITSLGDPHPHVILGEVAVHLIVQTVT